MSARGGRSRAGTEDSKLRGWWLLEAGEAAGVEGQGAAALAQGKALGGQEPTPGHRAWPEPGPHPASLCQVEGPRALWRLL